MTQNASKPGQIERVERALLVLAYFIELDGDVHLPMYEQFERELAEMKAAADVRSRASERLAAYRKAGGWDVAALTVSDSTPTPPSLPDMRTLR